MHWMCSGTGKTHTMLGSQEQPGIMVHTLNSLFRRMEETKEDTEYQVSMGYLEVGREGGRERGRERGREGREGGRATYFLAL